jgi:membrane-bound lytic murein transglycosylase A
MSHPNCPRLPSPVQSILRRAAPLLAAGLGACALIGPPAPCPSCTTAPAAPPEAAPAFAPAHWQDLPGWSDDALDGAWAAFRQSCASGRWRNGAAATGVGAANGKPALPPGSQEKRAEATPAKPATPVLAAPGIANAPSPGASAAANGQAPRPSPDWAPACAAAAQLGEARPPLATLRAFFEQQFVPWALVNPDGTREGTVTGYYEPLLFGSRRREGAYAVPIHGVPDDLLTIELGDLFPELKGKRVRGRVDGRRVVPYYDRGGIRARAAELREKVLVWATDPVEVFFLQIQGSGRVQLPDGTLMRIGYADQNGHPYNSIGRLLVERGELTLDQASMQGIQAWARANPDKLDGLLDANPSYVFFRELPSGEGGPLGALGVPLTARRSIAVDPAVVPLGAPVFLATTEPNSPQPLNRLMFAQDTGGAIKGVVRADFFWGFGAEAGQLAGRMRQSGRMWVLLPRATIAADLPALARQ